MRIQNLVTLTFLIFCVSKAYAFVIPENTPFVPVPDNYSTYKGNFLLNTHIQSLESYQADLERQQSFYKQNLDAVTKKLNSLTLFLKAQASLKLNWIDKANGAVSSRSLVVSADGQSFKLCHATLYMGTHPGIMTNAGCLITYGGNSFVAPSYQVLSGTTTTSWQTVVITPYQHPGDIVSDPLWSAKTVPIQGGFENGSPLYFCLANYNNKNYVGKTINDNCDISVDNKEIPVKVFKVLFGNIQ